MAHAAGRLQHVGDWVEFWLEDGEVSATDHAGGEFVWNARVDDDQTWVPTVAWTGKSLCSNARTHAETNTWHMDIATR